MKLAIVALLASSYVNAQEPAAAAPTCSDEYTQVAATEKVRADSAFAFAETLISTATGLRDTAVAELPAAQ